MHILTDEKQLITLKKLTFSLYNSYQRKLKGDITQLVE